MASPVCKLELVFFLSNTGICESSRGFAPWKMPQVHVARTHAERINETFNQYVRSPLFLYLFKLSYQFTFKLISSYDSDFSVIETSKVLKPSLIRKFIENCYLLVLDIKFILIYCIIKQKYVFNRTLNWLEHAVPCSILIFYVIWQMNYLFYYNYIQ